MRCSLLTSHMNSAIPVYLPAISGDLPTGNVIAFIEFKGIFPDDRIHAAFEMTKEVYNLEKCSL